MNYIDRLHAIGCSGENGRAREGRVTKTPPGGQGSQSNLEFAPVACVILCILRLFLLADELRSKCLTCTVTSV